jgi:hypothetical protein
MNAIPIPWRGMRNLIETLWGAAGTSSSNFATSTPIAEFGEFAGRWADRSARVNASRSTLDAVLAQIEAGRPFEIGEHTAALLRAAVERQNAPATPTVEGWARRLVDDFIHADD